MADCLVIEDSVDVRRVMCRLLEALGRDVSEADGPAAAVDLCRGDAPKMVFLDWDLPDFGALEFLRALPDCGGQRPKIVLCITHNDPRELALARAAGATHQLMKPYDTEMIREVIDDLESADGAEAPSQKASA